VVDFHGRESGYTVVSHPTEVEAVHLLGLKEGSLSAEDERRLSQKSFEIKEARLKAYQEEEARKPPRQPSWIDPLNPQDEP
jgi:hypothetical protein